MYMFYACMHVVQILIDYDYCLRLTIRYCVLLCCKSSPSSDVLSKRLLLGPQLWNLFPSLPQSRACQRGQVASQLHLLLIRIQLLTLSNLKHETKSEPLFRSKNNDRVLQILIFSGPPVQCFSERAWTDVGNRAHCKSMPVASPSLPHLEMKLGLKNDALLRCSRVKPFPFLTAYNKLYILFKRVLVNGFSLNVSLQNPIKSVKNSVSIFATEMATKKQTVV